MAALIATVGGLGNVLALGGTIVSTLGAIQSGKAQNAAAEYQAQQLDAQGKTERAVSQREAQEERRQKELAISRARVVGAASAGGQDLALLGDIEEDGELRALSALWQGEEAAKGRKNQAAATRFEGKQAKKAGLIKGLGTLMDGGASFYENYG